MPFPQFSRPMHALVVDDDPVNLIVAKKLCGLFGGTAETTDCAQQSVVLCATGEFDVVLMDVRMPHTSGIDAAIAIRALPGPAGRTPIIAVTGDIGSRSEALCAQAGMNAFVEKPIRSQRLFDAMEAVLVTSEERLLAVKRVLSRS